MSELSLPGGYYKSFKLPEFAIQIKELGRTVGFRMSARGWGYYLEGEGLITKGELDKVENLINECRELGLLPVEFTAQEDARMFSGIEEAEDESPVEYMRDYLENVLTCEEWYTPDWWVNEKYYIQMLVEKIDLKTLFKDVCTEYHIPIATAKGWSSILQRADYARRFKEAEERRLKCVLLYCGDHDPDGLRISDFIRENLNQLKNITWNDGTKGYDPVNLEIDRIGLSYEYITKNNLTWIENLETGSGGYIAKVVNDKIVQGRTKNGKPHPNFNLPYIQEYLKTYGVRKVEANAILKNVDAARDMCRQVIEKWLGNDALDRFEQKRDEIRKIMQDFRSGTGLDAAVVHALEIIDQENKVESDDKKN